MFTLLYRYVLSAQGKSYIQTLYLLNFYVESAFDEKFIIYRSLYAICLEFFFYFVVIIFACLQNEIGQFWALEQFFSKLLSYRFWALRHNKEIQILYIWKSHNFFNESEL